MHFNKICICLLQELREAISMLRKDKESNTDFIQKSKIYLENVNQQIAMKEDDKEMLRKYMCLLFFLSQSN